MKLNFMQNSLVLAMHTCPFATMHHGHPGIWNFLTLAISLHTDARHWRTQWCHSFVEQNESNGWICVQLLLQNHFQLLLFQSKFIKLNVSIHRPLSEWAFELC